MILLIILIIICSILAYLYVTSSITFLSGGKPNSKPSARDSVVQRTEPISSPAQSRPPAKSFTYNMPGWPPQGPVQPPGAPAALGQVAHSNTPYAAGLRNMSWEQFLRLSFIPNNSPNAVPDQANPVYAQYYKGLQDSSVYNFQSIFVRGQ